LDNQPYKILDILDHIWPYIAGFFATVWGAARLGLMDRKRTLDRIKNLEKLVEASATKHELYSCRKEVNEQGSDSEHRIMDAINDMKKSSSDIHLKIVEIVSNMVAKGK